VSMMRRAYRHWTKLDQAERTELIFQADAVCAPRAPEFARDHLRGCCGEQPSRGPVQGSAFVLARVH